MRKDNKFLYMRDLHVTRVTRVRATRVRAKSAQLNRPEGFKPFGINRGDMVTSDAEQFWAAPEKGVQALIR